jgi:N-acetylmuramic acid 6-phosphate etherase
MRDGRSCSLFDGVIMARGNSERTRRRNRKRPGSEHLTSHIKHHPSPPDRGHLVTERRLRASANLDALSIAETLRLINAQDATLAATVRAAIPRLTRLVRDIVSALQAGGRLIYLGAGTSGRLGVLDASECPPTFHCPPGVVIGLIAGGDRALRRSSEGAEDDPNGAAKDLARVGVSGGSGDSGDSGGDVVVGIAAGGTTPYVLGGLALARRSGATTALICCLKRAQVPQYAVPAIDHLICLPVGPEVLTGSTRMKAGTVTKLTLNMITTTAMAQLGKAWGNLMVDLRATNAKLRDRAARVLADQCHLSRVDALALLDRADGRVKLALVMHRCALSAEAAQRLLDTHAGRLRPILGPPQ